MTHKRKWNKRSYLWILLSGAILLGLLTAGGAARYTHLESKANEGSSQQFYFTSDYLTEAGKTYQLSENTTSLKIELRNYVDALRWSDETISYTCSIKKYGTEMETDTMGTISRDENKGSTAEIVIPDMSAGTYEVTATATAPFAKTLKGTFVVPQQDNAITYEVNDSSDSPYVLLTVSTKKYAGNITISWPEDVIPDSTEEAFQSCNTWNNGSYIAGRVTTAVENYSSYTYQFFKTNVSQKYDKDSITVTKAQ